MVDTSADLSARQTLPSLRSEEHLASLLQAPLMPFDPTSRFEQAVSFGLEEYLDLVDAMGRAVPPSKRGVIPSSTPRLLHRLGMDAKAFIHAAAHFFRDFASAVGTPAKLIELAAHHQQRCLRRLACVPCFAVSRSAGSIRWQRFAPRLAFDLGAGLSSHGLAEIAK